MYFELEESEKEAMDQKLRAAKAHLEQEMVQIKEQHETVLLRQGEAPRLPTRAHTGLFCLGGGGVGGGFCGGLEHVTPTQRLVLVGFGNF